MSNVLNSVQGRHFIVTGGSSGLGEAIVSDLLANGALVTIFDRNPAEKPVAETLSVDVCDDQGVAQAVEKAVKSKGRIDGAINCAGVGSRGLTVNKKHQPHDLDHFKTCVEINVVGTFNVCSKVAAAMSKQPLQEGHTDRDRGLG